MAIQTYNVPTDRIIHKAKVDFSQRCIQKTIHIVQYDKSSVIAVELFLNGEEYVLPSHADVKVRWGKRDRTFIYKDALGCDANRHIVYFDVDEQMSFFYGPCNPILEVVISGSKSGSSVIPFEIDRNPIQDGDIESSNEYVDLSKSVQEVKDVRDDILGTMTKYYNKVETDEQIGDLGDTVNGRISPIEAKIPAQASADNQLADKSFVNSSLNSIAAFYITKDQAGNAFETKAQLFDATTVYSGGEARVPTRNDYAIVRVDETQSNATTRYIYQNGWQFQYIVNETALTSDQLKSLNFGITAELVAKLTGINMNSKLDKNTGAGRYVYSHNGETQEQIGVAQQTVGVNTIVQRTAEGTVRTATPVNELDAVNKAFYDANKPTLTKLPDGSYSIEFKE